MLPLAVLIRKRSVVIGLAVIVIGGGYGWYRSRSSVSATPQYVTQAVAKGTITTSISGSGQVAVSNQLDVKPKVSGEAVRVPIANNQVIRAGDVLAQLDTRNVEKTIRDAAASLESAKLTLEKLVQPVDALSLLQAEHALAQAEENKQTTEADLASTYESGFNKVANTFLTLPTVMSGLQDALYGTSLGGGGQWNRDYYVNAVESADTKVIQYAADAATAYTAARTAYDASFQHYKLVDRSADVATIEGLINETYTTTRLIAEAVKSTSNLVQFYVDKLTERSLKPSAGATTYLTSLNSYTAQTSSALSDLLSVQTSIQSNKDGLVNADRTIAEKTESLAKLKAGPDPLDIKSQQLAITQRENALLDAKQTLPDYTVRAPFGGLVAAVGSKVGDSVSSGTTIATLITNQHLAVITLNEVDVAKVAVGQKAILTLDALDGLTVAGQVAEVSALGSVSQGVVSYSVKIGFATQDDRIKTGMSVSASIITEVKQDVLLVPNSAVKTQANAHYVQVLEQGQPKNVTVQIGLSNDTMTEITSGVSEGTEVITKIITAAATTTTQPSGGIIPGFGGGNAVRVGGGAGGFRGN